MDIHFTAQETRFQQDVKTFFAEHFSAELAAQIASDYHTGIVRWQRILYQRGWIAPGWPVEHGGCAWSLIQQYIYEKERCLAGAPAVHPTGLKMLGPILLNFGSAEQQQRHLPPILQSEITWCQGYSEPGAGSDLAGLQTRAERRGDHYLVNGSKIWTSGADRAQWMFALVRTADTAKKQAGISLLLIEMTTPGIQVRPIKTLDGSAHFCQVFLDNVQVPVANRVGEENQGWKYATTLLGYERTNVIPVHSLIKELNDIKAYVKAEPARYADSAIRHRIGALDAELMALEFTTLRALNDEMSGAGSMVQASLLKLKGSELWQDIDQLRFELAGQFAGIDYRQSAIADSFAEKAQHDKFFGFAHTIYGGSSEIQKNIIAKAVLNLVAKT